MASAPPTLITPKFVFDYPLSPNVSDYRCVVNADATAVIVERSTLTAMVRSGRSCASWI